MEKKTQGKIMENIFIKDTTGILGNVLVEKENSGDTTILAKKGYVDESLNNKLILFDGIIQSKNKENQIKNITFKKTQISMDGYVNRTIKKPKIQETNTLQLIKCYFFRANYAKTKYDSRFDLLNKAQLSCPYMYVFNRYLDSQIGLKKWDNASLDELFESHFMSTRENIGKRFGVPLFIPLITLISSFLLISIRKKSYSLFRKYFYFIVSFLLLVFIEIIVKYSGISLLYLITFFLMPFLIFPIIYASLFSKFKTEKYKQ